MAIPNSADEQLSKLFRGIDEMIEEETPTLQTLYQIEQKASRDYSKKYHKAVKSRKESNKNILKLVSVRCIDHHLLTFTL